MFRKRPYGILDNRKEKQLIDISQTEKTVNEKQIAFIICTNDQLRLDECLMYLIFLNIPEGFTTDTITIQGAAGMCAGYNAAMKESNAKYKIYMHQDVFITDRDFLSKLLQIFASDSRIGMVGAIGTPRLDYTAMMWDMPRVGKLCRYRHNTPYAII